MDHELPALNAAIETYTAPIKKDFPSGVNTDDDNFVNKGKTTRFLFSSTRTNQPTNQPTTRCLMHPCTLCKTSISGFQNWEKGRLQWLTKNDNLTDKKKNPHRGATDLNVDEVIDCIVSNRWRSALKGGKDKAMFPRAVPLPQMIDILTDLWEAEGLDV